MAVGTGHAAKPVETRPSLYTMHPMLMTFPNQLTLLRMGFIPVFIISIIYGKNGLALLIFLIAGLTDALDGILARRLNQRTAIGAFLDPMADKLLVTAAFVVLSMPDICPFNCFPLWLTTLVISRDVIIVVAALIIHMSYGRRSFLPSPYGKVATTVQVAAVFIVLLLNWLEWQPPLVNIVYAAVLVMTIVSGLHYLWTLPRLANSDS